MALIREEKECAQKIKLDTIRTEYQKVLDSYAGFTSEVKAEATWIVKDCKLVLKALREEKLEKIPKRK